MWAVWQALGSYILSQRQREEAGPGVVLAALGTLRAAFHRKTVCALDLATSHPSLK